MGMYRIRRHEFLVVIVSWYLKRDGVYKIIQQAAVVLSELLKRIKVR
jgi:hypothetical protein